jgi:hypothetical protein
LVAVGESEEALDERALGGAWRDGLRHPLEPLLRRVETLMRVLKAMWCRLVHARFTVEPMRAANMPLWRCTCDVCGRVWAEED